MRIPLLAITLIYFSASVLAEGNSSTATHVDTTPDKSSPSALPTETTPTTQPSSTSSSSSTSSTTLQSTSSSAPTTSSEPPTTTSTIAPTTTSTAPTTPSTAPTTPETTTHQDTTSQSPTPTEPPKPTTAPPIPVPEPGSWNVTEGNFTCIRASLTVLFKIELEGSVYYIALEPTASSVKSKCNTSDNTQLLSLMGLGYNLEMVFAKESDSVYVKNTTFSYTLPKSSETFSNDTHLFDVKSGNSYLCKTESTILLGNVTMEIKSIQIQAFGSENNNGFGIAEECGADNPINDIVPIAVGVALLALVVVVLIAYLVGRRRSRQKGYQSV